MNDPAVYTAFRLFSSNLGTEISEWPQRTDICCWWCCHRFECVPVCVPALYSLEKRLFEVFGVFCSWNCAKAYVQSGYSSDSSEQLMWMRILAHEVFKCNIDELNAAPPRIFLKMFGGHLDISDFRAKSQTVTTTVLKPPLVSYPMVMQEVSTHMQGLTVAGGEPSITGAESEKKGAARAPSKKSPAGAAAPAALTATNLNGRILGLSRPTPRRPILQPQVEANPENSLYVQFMRKKQEEVIAASPCDVQTGSVKSPSSLSASARKSRKAKDAPPASEAKTSKKRGTLQQYLKKAD